MARGDSLYARLDVDFIRSYRWLKLSPGARCLYLFLWVHALELRRESMARPDNYFLASQAGLPRHPIASYLRLLHDSKLLIVNDCTIQIVGIAEKHKQFQWKAAPNGDQMGPIQSPNAPPGTERNGTERNGTKKKASRPKRKPKKPEPLQPEMFSLFYDKYAYKIDPQDAIKAWNENMEEGINPQDIIDTIPNYDAHLKKTGHNKKYPAGYLRAERWKSFIKPLADSEEVKIQAMIDEDEKERKQNDRHS